MSRISRRFLSGLLPVLMLHAVLAHAAAAKESAWQTDFSAAQAKAKAQKESPSRRIHRLRLVPLVQEDPGRRL